jgi:hypothetical protein
VGDEAWDTFQVSCNEFRSTICKVCTGKNQFGTRMTCRGTHQGMPWAGHGLPWHTPRHAMGKPWHKPRHFLKKYLEFGRDILHTCLEKSYLQACQVLRFLKKKFFFLIFLIEKIGKFIKNRKWVVSGR